MAVFSLIDDFRWRWNSSKHIFNDTHVSPLTANCSNWHCAQSTSVRTLARHACYAWHGCDAWHGYVTLLEVHSYTNLSKSLPCVFVVEIIQLLVEDLNLRMRNPWMPITESAPDMLWKSRSSSMAGNWECEIQMCLVWEKTTSFTHGSDTLVYKKRMKFTPCLHHMRTSCDLTP